MAKTCANFQLSNSLKFVGNCLTKKTSTYVCPTLAPCGGIAIDRNCFKVVNGVVTSSDFTGKEIAHVVSPCGGLRFDKTYFKRTTDGLALREEEGEGE